MKKIDGNKHMGMLFKQLNKEMITMFNRELEVYGITGMQSEILRYIHFKESEQNLNQKDIERFFHSSNPTITGILKRLQAKGLISREPSPLDGRYKIIKLTDKGKVLINESIKVKVEQMEDRLTQNLTKDEEDELRRLLMKVIEGFKGE